jgi:hypothetical protein
MVLILAFECMAQSSPGHPASGDLAFIAGPYDCSPASKADPFSKLILFSDGRWLQRGFLDTTPHKIVWTDVHNRWGKSRIATIRLRHGTFQVRRDTISLFTMEPGFSGSGRPSWFDKKAPDADLVLTKRFRMMPASGEWIEVMPFNSSRPPMKCRAGSTM